VLGRKGYVILETAGIILATVLSAECFPGREVWHRKEQEKCEI
jgi:hypothetical protein